MVPKVREDAVVYADAEQMIRRRGSFLLALSLASPTAPALRALAAAIEQLDSPALLMVVIDSSARAPDGPTKDAIRQITVRLQHRIAGFAYVVEGEGFGAAAIRSAISFISMFANYSFPQRVMATVDEAATWLLRHFPANVANAYDAPRIVRAVDDMRREVRSSKLERRNEQA